MSQKPNDHFAFEPGEETTSERASSSPPGERTPRSDGASGARRLEVALLCILAGLGILAGMYAARAVLIPTTGAILLSLLFKPAVRRMDRWGVRPAITAILIVSVVTAACAVSIVLLSEPVARFIARAPEHIETIEKRIRGLKKPVEEITKATKEIEKLSDIMAEDGGDEEAPGEGEAESDDSDGEAESERGRPPAHEPQNTHGQNARAASAPEPEESPPPLQVEMKSRSFAAIVFDQTMAVLFGLLIMLVLLFFLLAAGDMFMRKFTGLLRRPEAKWEAILAFRELEREISRYLGVYTLINIGLGTATGLAFWFLGVPNAWMWGILAGAANYILYLGPWTFIAASLVVGLVTFESLLLGLAPAATFLLFNVIESNIVSPLIFGRRLALNPVAVFLAILFWGWLWGVAGALMAVPILVCLRIAGDHIPAMKAVAVFLSGASKAEVRARTEAAAPATAVSQAPG